MKELIKKILREEVLTPEKIKQKILDEFPVGKIIHVPDFTKIEYRDPPYVEEKFDYKNIIIQIESFEFIKTDQSKKEQPLVRIKFLKGEYSIEFDRNGDLSQSNNYTDYLFTDYLKVCEKVFKKLKFYGFESILVDSSVNGYTWHQKLRL